MGLLSEGSPLDWPETKANADHVRKHGIKQFINLYHKLQDRKKDVLYWGDEVRKEGEDLLCIGGMRGMSHSKQTGHVRHR